MNGLINALAKVKPSFDKAVMALGKSDASDSNEKLSAEEDMDETLNRLIRDATLAESDDGGGDDNSDARSKYIPTAHWVPYVHYGV